MEGDDKLLLALSVEATEHLAAVIKGAADSPHKWNDATPPECEWCTEIEAEANAALEEAT